MDKLPNIGDIIVHRGVITEVHPIPSFPEKSYVRYTDKMNNTRTLYLSCVDEILPKPWVPEVGEMVRMIGYTYSYEYRGTVDDHWVLQHTDGDLFITKSKPEDFEPNT